MRVPSLLVSVLMLFSLVVPTVAADEGHGRGHGRGDRDDRTISAATIHLASGRASRGRSDPNVKVTRPGSSSSNSAAVCSSTPSSWSSLRGAAWISPIASCTTDQDQGEYRYEITFNVPSGSTNLRLTGSVLADDTVSVQVNGQSVNLSSGSGSAFATTSTFDTGTSNALREGSNTLTFLV